MGSSELLYLPLESGKEEAFCCQLPCCEQEDHNEISMASSDERVVSIPSTATQKSCDTFAYADLSRLSPRGVYRTRSGQSSRVRFVLTIESRLSGEFDPVSDSSENNQLSNASQCNPLLWMFSKEPSVSETITPKPILRLDHVPVPDEQTDEIWMNVDQEERETNDENNGMVVVIGPRSVELQEACSCKRKDKYNYLDEKESSDISDSEISNIRDIPTDVTLFITPSMDDISQISRIHDEPKADVSRTSNKPSSRQNDSYVSILKRLIRCMRRQGGAYKVVVHHGKERFLI